MGGSTIVSYALAVFYQQAFVMFHLFTTDLADVQVFDTFMFSII